MKYNLPCLLARVRLAPAYAALVILALGLLSVWLDWSGPGRFVALCAVLVMTDYKSRCHRAGGSTAKETP